MNKGLKITIAIFAAILALILAAFAYYFIVTSKYSLDEKKLVNLDRSTVFLDGEENVVQEEFNGISVTDLSDMPEFTANAFIAIEDKRFYKHGGTDVKALFRATLNNVKTASFKEGASTISQQLIKNTHLSNEKTLKRKLIEIKLSRKLEKKYDKAEILEKYLNTIYFGENCYGITRAAKTYFDKTPAELSVNESAALAGIIKAPSVYSPFINEEKCNQRKNVVLKAMYEQDYITKAEFDVLKNENVSVTEQKNARYDFLCLAKKEIRDFVNANAYKAKRFTVYTTLNSKIQNAIEGTFLIEEDRNGAIIALDKNNRVAAYVSDVKEQKRNLGSTIKPLLVYAPAIEENVVYSCTKIKDEKTDFNGYSPSNFNDKYYGNVTVKEAIAKSLNVCAVKTLNFTGIEKSLSYLKKTNLEITEKDDSLCLALGSTYKGATLKEISAAYGVFKNDGKFFAPTCITKITDEKGNVLYAEKQKSTSVFSAGTSNVINNALEECVKSGTAKKLSFIDVPLCAKTGTAGNEKGNTDAYCISYNGEYTLGVWAGAKENSLMSNEITGGTVPAETSRKIWSTIYENDSSPSLDFNNGVTFEYIDKLSYDKEDKVILADDNAPERFKKKEIFSLNNVPKEKSSYFSSPTIEKPKIQVNNDKILISLCQTELLDCVINRSENGIKTTVYDSVLNGKKNSVTDDTLAQGLEYSYYITPYFNSGNNRFYGKEIFIGTVKIPLADALPDAPDEEEKDKNETPWWQDEFA